MSQEKKSKENKDMKEGYGLVGRKRLGKVRRGMR